MPNVDMQTTSFVQESFASMMQNPGLEYTSFRAGQAHGGAALLQRTGVEADQYMRSHDPSLRGGFHVVYDREVPFELRAAEAPGANSGCGAAFEGVMVKILVRGGSGGVELDGLGSSAPTELHVQLSSESDLFFHHSCAINGAGFEVLREEQRLTCGFGDFVGALQRLFNSCIAEPQTFVAVLLVAADGTSVLQLVQLLNYKVTELLLLPLRELPASLIREHVTYRYRAMRHRLDTLGASLSDVAAFVKVRDPAALPVLQQQNALSQRQLQIQGGSTVGTQTLPPPEPVLPAATGAPGVPPGAPSPIPGLPPLGTGPANSAVTGCSAPAIGPIGGIPLVGAISSPSYQPAGTGVGPIGPSHPSYTY